MLFMEKEITFLHALLIAFVHGIFVAAPESLTSQPKSLH